MDRDYGFRARADGAPRNDAHSQYFFPLAPNRAALVARPAASLWEREAERSEAGEGAESKQPQPLRTFERADRKKLA